jgi:hypothetical protein
MTAVQLTNITLTKGTEENTTPYEIWYKRKPEVRYLRVWGCIAYCQTPKLRDLGR